MNRYTGRIFQVCMDGQVRNLPRKVFKGFFAIFANVCCPDVLVHSGSGPKFYASRGPGDGPELIASPGKPKLGYLISTNWYRNVTNY